MKIICSILLAAGFGFLAIAGSGLFGQRAPSTESVLIAVTSATEIEAGCEVPFTIQINNTNNSDIRVVGLTWC